MLVEGHIVDFDQEHLFQALGFIACLVVDIELEGFSVRLVRNTHRKELGELLFRFELPFL